MTRDINAASLELIKSYEGWRDTAYLDAVNVLTIGYGHTSVAGEPIVKPGMKITRAEGEAILRKDLAKYAKAVEDAVKVPLTDNQFGALVSFCYNVGPGNFRKSSVLERVNAKRFEDVPLRLLLWNKAGGKVLKGLTNRRVAEGALFKAGGVSTAPKPIPAPTPEPMVVLRPEPATTSKKEVVQEPAKGFAFWLQLIAKALAALFSRKGH